VKTRPRREGLSAGKSEELWLVLFKMLLLTCQFHHCSIGTAFILILGAGNQTTDFYLKLRYDVVTKLYVWFPDKAQTWCHCTSEEEIFV
jgi:hypothetical protein